MSFNPGELNNFNNVVCDRNGGKVLFATDDFFAVAENLLKVEEPEWREGEYTEFGKWMDGWETRRKRKSGHDFCLIQLAAPAVLYAVDIDTAYFTGNFAPSVSIQACAKCPQMKGRDWKKMGTEASERDVKFADELSKDWTEILAPVALSPGYPDTRHNYFQFKSTEAWHALRLNLFPDGGVARLRVFGKVLPPTNIVPGKEVDLVGFVNGGECVSYSNAHYGHPKNLMNLHKGIGMFDGWETARRLDRPTILKELPCGLLNHTGSEWCVLKLGLPGRIQKIVIDTHHFKGNYPDLAKVEACDEEHFQLGAWDEILPFAKMKAHKEQTYPISCNRTFHYIRVTMQPDGGISRVRVLGVPQIESQQRG